MPRLRLTALLALLLLAAACQRPSDLPRRASGADLEVQAAQALAGGRYADAANLYRQALRGAADRFTLHYGLAVASSYLEHRDDAVREFRWVLQYGPPRSAEVQAARQWLAMAGALPGPSFASAAYRPEPERAPGNASLEGHAAFAKDGAAAQSMARLQLFLVGQPNSPTQRERYNLRTDEQGNFRFPDVVPGPYKLTNRVAGEPIWRLRVELKPSEVKVLELSPANSTAIRDDFPE